MKKFIIGTIIAFGILQLIPYGHNHENPKIFSTVQWDSNFTKETFAKACLDCHSNQTKWPWYSNIAPISWLVQHDVEDGRKHFNISMIHKQRKNKLDEASQEVEEGEMPPLVYIINHPEASLTEQEKALFINGLKKTFND